MYSWRQQLHVTISVGIAYVFLLLEQVPLKSQEIAFLLVQAGSWEVEVTNFKAFHFQSDTLCCPQRTFTCFLVQFFFSVLRLECHQF